MRIIYSILLLSALIFTPVFAQEHDPVADDSVCNFFEEQDPLSEYDIVTFVKTQAYRHLIEAEKGLIPQKTAIANVEKDTGFTMERYVYILAKLVICYQVKEEAEQNELSARDIFMQMPEYIRPNEREVQLIIKYEQQIASTFKDAQSVLDEYH